MTTTDFDAVNKVWSGPKPDVEVGKNQNFGEIILEKLIGEDPDRLCQIDGYTGESLTVAEIRLRTIRCAQNLMKLGCDSKQRIAIIARNHQNATPLLFAAFCIGSPITPIDVLIVQDGASHVLKRVEPSSIFCDADILLEVKKITDDINLEAKFFSVRGSVKGFDSINSLVNKTGDEESFVCAKVADSFSEAAVIACSSGTTGLPKSICITHALLTYAFSSGIHDAPFTGMNFSSLYWFSGVLLTIASSFAQTRVFTAQPFSTDLFFDLVEKYKVEAFFGPSSQMQAFLKSKRCTSADLSFLLMCYTVGGNTPAVLIQKLKELIPDCNFVTTYGLTEIGGGGTITAPGDLEEYPNSVGSLIPGLQMKIISENTNEKCGIGESGEIYVKTSIPAMGYFRDQIANQKSFDADDFLLTGDIGYFDETGRLYIIGRKKEIFKNRGFAIWPTELENAIQKSQAIRHVCDVGVHDDEILTDLPAAVVVRNEKFTITQDDVYKLISNQFASYKWLEGGVYFVDELPMTPSGKVLHSKAKQWAQQFYETKKQRNTLSKL